MKSFASVIENAVKDTLRHYAGDTLPSSWVRSSLDNIDYIHLKAEEYFPQVLVQSSVKYQEDEGATLAVDIQVDCATYFEDDVRCTKVSSILGNVEGVMDRFYWGNDTDEAQAFFAEVVQRDFPTFCFGGFTPNAGGFLAIADGVQVMSYAGTIHFTL